MFHSPPSVRTVLPDLILGRVAVWYYIYGNEIKHHGHRPYLAKSEMEYNSRSLSFYTTTINPSAFLSSGPYHSIVLDGGLRKGGTSDGGPIYDITAEGSGSIWSWVWSPAFPPLHQDWLQQWVRALNEYQTPHIRLRSPYRESLEVGMCKRTKTEREGVRVWASVCIYMCTDRLWTEIGVRHSVVWVKESMSWCKKEDLTTQHIHKGSGKNGIVCSGVLTLT